MDHQDIVELLEAGRRDDALTLIGERERKRGISGEDRQVLAGLLRDEPAPEPPKQRNEPTRQRMTLDGDDENETA